jgi:CRISPR/Cas system CSM-associated protein Csm3 (group 7 of RAMP superfamily)
MNPYDFVPIDTEHPPERRKPVWHNALTPDKAHPGKLYSGYLYLYIKAETPLFIHDATSSMQNPDYPGQHLRNGWDEYIIPGTSIKGLLRTVVETLCNGCMTVFRTPQEYTHNPLPNSFSYCQHNTSLCISCRLFGMMQAGQRNAQVFLGKVNIGDARAYENNPEFYGPIYTAVLDAPKPRHRAFYLDEQGRYIAGRKFYFHHAGEPHTERRLIPIRDTGNYRNQYIEPLDIGTDFDARIDFTNLEADEFAALLLAIMLQLDMRHKIGYGKPIGLGSVQLAITALQLVDYSKRYKNFHAGRGIAYYKGDSLTDLLNKQMAPLDEQIKAAWQRFSAQPALQHLHCIWQWPPDESVEYAYPSQRWFKTNSQARVRDTRDLYPGD